MTAQTSPFRGLVDFYENGVARGWAIHLNRRGPLNIHVLLDGQEVAAVEAASPRLDLGSLIKSGEQNIGFTFEVPASYLDGQARALSFRFPDGSIVPVSVSGNRQDFTEELLIGNDAAQQITGYFEGLRQGQVVGWVLIPGESGALEGGATVALSIDGRHVARVKADRLRGDVGESLNVDGLCGFSVPVPTAFRDGKPHLYAVTVEPSGVALTNSPLRSSIADDRLEAELVEVTETIDRLHRDLSALRRKIRDIMPHGGHNLADYDAWARAYYARLRTAVDHARTRAPLPHSPCVSVLCPVYKPILTDFIQAVQSVMAQTYPHWELIFIDDGRADATISRQIDTFCAANKRMRVISLPKNQGIAGATNAGLMEAKGDYIAFFDHDDVLVDVALEVMVRAALRTHAQLLYSDEDKIDLHGRFRDPNLKPDFSYRYLLGCNYICHLTMVHAALARKIGLLDGTYNGAQDHDFLLRAVEILQPADIYHVRDILYHWRITENSTAASLKNKSYAVEAGVRAVAAHLKRRGLKAKPASIDKLTVYDVRWQYRASPRVTIIIPFKDEIDMTERCVTALLDRTQYAAFDIILIDNWSVTPAAKRFVARMRKIKNVTVLRVEEAFNFSRLNNFAVRHTDAPFILFMNNDVVIENTDWLRLIVNECLAAEDVAVVGNMLLYKDETIQHAGVITGPDVIGTHAHRRFGRHDKGYIGRIALTHEVSAVTAACMLVRRDVFLAVGGFDEDHLSIAYNDVDLCLKIHQAGHRVLYVADSVAHHYESHSRGTDDRPEHETRFFLETQFMREKWAGYEDFEFDPFYARYFRTDATPFMDLRRPEEIPAPDKL